MPSTLVHMAVAALVGAALLAHEFDRRSITVVVLVAAVPDLDAFLGLAFPGAHRAVLHTLLFPAALAALVWYDTRVRERSLLRGRYGRRGVHVAWVALAGLLVGGVLPDLFTNGVNALYPLHDTFYTVNGRLLLTDQRGVVQTFVDLSPDRPARTTENLRYVTGVNPASAEDPRDVERVFPVATSGIQLMLLLAAAFVVWARFRVDRLPTPRHADRRARNGDSSGTGGSRSRTASRGVDSRNDAGDPDRRGRTGDGD